MSDCFRCGNPAHGGGLLVGPWGPLCPKCFSEMKAEKTQLQVEATTTLRAREWDFRVTTSMPRDNS